MISNSEIQNAIVRCIRLRIPFAYVVMPGCDTGSFFAAMALQRYKNSSHKRAFVIREFSLNAIEPPLAICQELSVADIAAMGDEDQFEPAKVKPASDGTSYEDYCQGCEGVISYLKQYGGKTVLARVIAEESGRALIDVIREYFEKFPDTFRFVYFTQHTGLWFGASPELLIDYDTAHGCLNTMSLAGTRKVGDIAEPWDSKNIEEHQFVTDFIVDELKSKGFEVEIYDSTPLRFGLIEHLCDRIRATGEADAVAILDSMSPTPALCGMPKKQAYEQIIATESHARLCYGGWVGVADRDRFTAYVNLRSAFVEPCGDINRYNLYVGGGITPKSVVEDEWTETERKAAILLEIIRD